MQPYTEDHDHDPPLPTADELVQSLLPSFLKLDTDGRVLRLDSFSKVVAPNSRCGWITGCAQFIERVIRHNEVSIQTASGFSQLLLYHLLVEKWGHHGFLDWLVYIRSEYTNRRNKCLANMQKYLRTDVFTWTAPAAGMFIWIKIDHTRHPDFHILGVKGVEDSIFNRALEEKVLVIPGSWFAINPLRDVFLRANFASIDLIKGEEAVQRLARAVEKELGLYTKDGNL
ncbi:Aromatic amino acid aminotransferase [Neolecta irregularis DAH-3]|uniref:Aromatic amino acid aminotransferase n=1 Tax=Neolecta irregularis (strain DAH-3) TaxID=1198029 RepID=A0A1U7LJB2_NEOID|nr:Aromatic amino acid aminotransferase [Neolecta irregularis DAH-3]|eukprot:OLL22737.1 Aromatic amino acid aminotransferase [Neolecta irregularis DAH-3]